MHLPFIVVQTSIGRCWKSAPYAGMLFLQKCQLTGRHEAEGTYRMCPTSTAFLFHQEWTPAILCAIAGNHVWIDKQWVLASCARAGCSMSRCYHGESREDSECLVADLSPISIQIHPNPSQSITTRRQSPQDAVLALQMCLMASGSPELLIIAVSTNGNSHKPDNTKASRLILQGNIVCTCAKQSYSQTGKSVLVPPPTHSSEAVLPTGLSLAQEAQA